MFDSTFDSTREHRSTVLIPFATGRYPAVMAQPSDLEARVAALETQVHELAERVRHSEQDAAAARVLAGGADRDVEQIRGEIRDFRQATASNFNAIREDLTDLRTSVNDGFVKVDRGFAEMRGRLDATAARPRSDHRPAQHAYQSARRPVDGAAEVGVNPAFDGEAAVSSNRSRSELAPSRRPVSSCRQLSWPTSAPMAGEDAMAAHQRQSSVRR